MLSALNLALLLVAAYLAFPLLYALLPASEPLELRDKIPAAHADYHRTGSHAVATVFRSFTPKELSVHDGNGPDGRVLCAIRGVVYDVTSGRQFYGPGGPYESFGGRDASRGLAKQSFDADVLAPLDGPIDPLNDLSPSELDNLRGASGRYGALTAQTGKCTSPYARAAYLLTSAGQVFDRRTLLVVNIAR